MPPLADRIAALRPPPVPDVDSQVCATIDAQFTTWASLLDPEEMGNEIRRVGLIAQESETQLHAVQEQIQDLVRRAQGKLQALLEQAQGMAMRRYEVIDALGRLERDLLAGGGQGDSCDGEREEEDREMKTDVQPRDSTAAAALEGEKQDPESVLRRLEAVHARMTRLAHALRWIAVLEQVVLTSQETLHTLHPPAKGPTPIPSSDPSAPPSLSQSPLAALQGYKSLHSLVARLHVALPQDMFLLQVSLRVREDTWRAIRRVLDRNLLAALDDIGWPKKVHYPGVPVDKRKAFERAFRDELTFQLESESLVRSSTDIDDEDDPTDPALSPAQTSALAPFVVMAQKVAPRFRFHFEGERGTNRLDKPEWAFSHILDLVFEQRAFAEGYLQPLLQRSGLGQVDAISEMIAQLLPLPLALLRHRFPHLLDHPALLAHTVYQTVVFDEAVRQAGFRYARTWKAVRARRRQQVATGDMDAAGRESEEWVGLTEQVLSTADWFDRWLAGEKNFADDQFHEIISSEEAWMIVPPESTALEGLADEGDESNEAVAAEAEYRPTMGARKVKALIEQVADRYMPLPTLKHRYPFLATIQIPLLKSYHGRIASSLDAFETLSSAFVRAVPGALSSSSGIVGSANDPARMTRGVGGLQRLAKAWISAAWVRDAVVNWQDEILYLELSAEIQADAEYRRRAMDDGIITLYSRDSNVYELRLEEFNLLLARAEDLIIKHITHEVEGDLKQHLTRRWDTATTSEETRLDPTLVSPLTTFSAQLAHLVRILPPSKSRKLYRAIVSHISNHIIQRAVYAGWSKFTETGGRELLIEVEAWIEASRHGLEDSNAIRFPEFAWAQLYEAARVLALPKELTPDKSMTYSQAMALVFGDDYHRFTESLGLKEMSQEQAQAVMRRRIECWR